MIGASSTIFALKASLSESIEVRLVRVKKALTAVEQREVKPVDKLARAIISVLKSIRRDPSVTSEQVALVADYRARCDRFDPRKPENRVTNDDTDDPKPSSPTLDSDGKSYAQKFFEELEARS